MKPFIHQLTDGQLEEIISHPTAASYLFYGTKRVGKFSSAAWLAKRLNCPQTADDGCSTCKLIDAGNYPDLIIITPEKTSIGIEQVQTMQRQLGLSRFYAHSRRVVIIDEADHLTTEAQNCLLKTLEEPPALTSVFLVAHQAERLLPTVRSRLRPVYFPNLSKSQVTNYLITELSLDGSKAEELYSLSDGTIGSIRRLEQQPKAVEQAIKNQRLAASLLKDNYFGRLVAAGQLAGGGIDLNDLAQAISGHVRQRLRQDPKSSLLATAQLEALARLKRNLAANVNPRLALEGLMLEL